MALRNTGNSFNIVLLLKFVANVRWSLQVDSLKSPVT